MELDLEDSDKEDAAMDELELGDAVIILRSGKVVLSDNACRDGDDEAGRRWEVGECKKLKGTVVLMKENGLGFNDSNASVLDRVDELLGQEVSLQLVSAVHGDPENALQAKLGKPAYLGEWISAITPLMAGDSAFKVTFDWNEEVETPGDVPGEGRVPFICNSWVYLADWYGKDRVFFSSKVASRCDRIVYVVIIFQAKLRRH
ncbi:hypothetical protein NL676_020163 [Syzygium grande]|nr:hypothetical protein NL676_020163 [Syzygium grande]